MKTWSIDLALKTAHCDDKTSGCSRKDHMLDWAGHPEQGYKEFQSPPVGAASPDCTVPQQQQDLTTSSRDLSAAEPCPSRPVKQQTQEVGLFFVSVVFDA